MTCYVPFRRDYDSRCSSAGRSLVGRTPTSAGLPPVPAPRQITKIPRQCGRENQRTIIKDASNARRTKTLRLRAITVKKARAGPVGTRRPCSDAQASFYSNRTTSPGSPCDKEIFSRIARFDIVGNVGYWPRSPSPRRTPAPAMLAFAIIRSYVWLLFHPDLLHAL